MRLQRDWSLCDPASVGGATVASLGSLREPQFDGSVANDRNEIAPPHRSSLRSRRHSNTSPNGSALCVTAKLPGHVRVGSKAALTAPKTDFRFTPKGGLNSDIAPCPKSARRRREHLQQTVERLLNQFI